MNKWWKAENTCHEEGAKFFYSSFIQLAQQSFYIYWTQSSWCDMISFLKLSMDIENYLEWGTGRVGWDLFFFPSFLCNGIKINYLNWESFTKKNYQVLFKFLLGRSKSSCSREFSEKKMNGAVSRLFLTLNNSLNFLITSVCCLWSGDNNNCIASISRLLENTVKHSQWESSIDSTESRRLNKPKLLIG